MAPVIRHLSPMGIWGNDKPDQKRQAGTSVGWLRSPQQLKVVKIAPADITTHAQWVTVTDADVLDSGRVVVKHHRRMLRFNAEQLWRNLIKQGWQRVPPQW